MFDVSRARLQVARHGHVRVSRGYVSELTGALAYSLRRNKLQLTVDFPVPVAPISLS